LVFCSLIRNFALEDEPQYGWWHIIGCSLMLFIAECGIEYGLLSVTQKILNLPNCLYIKKFCDFFQSYENYANKPKDTHKKQSLRQISRRACTGGYGTRFFKLK